MDDEVSSFLGPCYILRVYFRLCVCGASLKEASRRLARTGRAVKLPLAACPIRILRRHGEKRYSIK